MATSITSIATSGLNAAQAGLLTTSHNIANVNTTGYSRQEIVQGTTLPQYSGAGYIGSGVAVETVRRAYNDLLELQVRDSGSQAAAAQTLAAQLAAIDDLLGDPAAGLAPALSAFFEGVNAVAANPNDAAARQAMLGGAEALAARLRGVATRLDEMRAGANAQIASAVGTINATSAQIAELNNRILLAGSSGSRAQTPNDLLDQRDTLLRELNALIGAKAVMQSDGTLSVFLSSGQALVVGASAVTLAARADPNAPRDLAVGVMSGAAFLPVRPSDLSGGELAGLAAFRDGALTEARNALGRIAATLAAQFNDQHRLGVDRTGAAGGDFFAAGAPAASARTTNAGNAQLAVSVSDYGALATSNYSVSWDGANYRLTRLADGTVQSFASLPQTIDGVTIALASGAPAAGDSFLVEPTAAGASAFTLLVRDVSRIAAAAPIRTATSASNTGSGRISAGAVNPPAPANPNLQQTVTIAFTAANTFSVSGTGTGNPAGLAYTPGMTISYNGWSVTLEGAPAAGDVFTVSANTGGVSDNRNAVRLAALQTARGLDGGTASYVEAYGQLASDMGNRSRAAQVAQAAQQQLASQAGARQQSLSGVNLDEEAANLIRYQQAYQAAGKAIAIANSLFDTLLDSMR